MIANLSGRLAAFVAIAVVLAVLLLGWFVLLSPQRSKISRLDSQISETQTQIASTQAYVSSPNTKQAVARLSRLKTLLPNNVRMSQVIRQIATDATNAGVHIGSIAPQMSTAPVSAGAVPVTLTVDGHYGGLSKFFHLLRLHARVVDDKIVGRGRVYTISGISFSGGGAEGAITSTVNLNVYVNGSTAPPTATLTP
jgi:Tfp pilus assembly protein PilO